MSEKHSWMGKNLNILKRSLLEEGFEVTDRVVAEPYKLLGRTFDKEFPFRRIHAKSDNVAVDFYIKKGRIHVTGNERTAKDEKLLQMYSKEYKRSVSPDIFYIPPIVAVLAALYVIASHYPALIKYP